MNTGTYAVPASDKKVNTHLLPGLVGLVVNLVRGQMDAFTGRLANALLAHSEVSSNPSEANLCFQSGQMLKKNAYGYFSIAMEELELCLTKELIGPEKDQVDLTTKTSSLSLVSYEEMDQQLVRNRVMRHLEIEHAEQLVALNLRLAQIYGCENLNTVHNPFRPESFLLGLHQSWRKFNQDQDAQDLIVPFLRPEILFDLDPIYRALNETLVAHHILPDLQDHFRSKKNVAARTAKPSKAENDAPPAAKESPGLKQRLAQFFGLGESANSNTQVPQHNGSHANALGVNSIIAEGEFFQKLAQLQAHQAASANAAIPRLSQLRQAIPVQNPIEQKTLDLLGQVFDTILSNQGLPEASKELIAMLQIPVLKAALLNPDFFLEDQHPARRLVDLLSRHGPAVEAQNTESQELLQTMRKNVSKVQQEFGKKVEVFADAVKDLEEHIRKEDQATQDALQVPIRDALKKEKIREAGRAASDEISVRVGSGEVVAFVEAFLEQRWVKVLTLAYSIKEKKPQAVKDAIKTMDDLIWSVKPKITLEQKQELLHRLPTILSRLNKWLSLIRWEEAERTRFFTELAECHAALVRTPLDISPDKQLEIAVEVARQSAEKRLQRKQEQAAQAAAIDEHELSQIEQLERGVWVEFTMPEQSALTMRLAWVSPMRSLFIFTTANKSHSFSKSAEELAHDFQQVRAKILAVDKVVDRALQKVFAQ